MCVVKTLSKYNTNSFRGVGGEPQILAKKKRNPLVSNSPWKSIFQMNVHCHLNACELVFLIFEYLARYGIRMDPLVTERRQQSAKKPAMRTWGLLFTIIRGRERADEKSDFDGKITKAI